MKDLAKIHQNVEQLLKTYPNFRELKYRKELIWLYWKEYENLTSGISKPMWVYQLTSPDTISRAIRKLLEKNPKLRGETYQENMEEEKEHREFYGNA